MLDTWPDFKWFLPNGVLTLTVQRGAAASRPAEMAFPAWSGMRPAASSRSQPKNAGAPVSSCAFQWPIGGPKRQKDGIILPCPHYPRTVAAPKPYRILVVDDHAVVREGIKKILADAKDIKVAGEADCSRRALQLARQAHWDLVLLDIAMPDRSGLETLEMLKKEHPGIKVLMFSMHRESEYAMRAMKSGAGGYLNKQCSPDQLADAIRLVASGRKYISTELAQELASEISGERHGMPHEILSNREYQTLCMIASGLPVSAVADKLSLSVKTISMYRARLLKKMQLKNNAELTVYAIRKGLVD